MFLETLSTSIAFTSLSLINLLRTPFFLLPFTLTFIQQYRVSINRIRDFVVNRPDITAIPRKQGTPGFKKKKKKKRENKYNINILFYYYYYYYYYILLEIKITDGEFQWTIPESIDTNLHPLEIKKKAEKEEKKKKIEEKKLEKKNSKINGNDKKNNGVDDLNKNKPEEKKELMTLKNINLTVKKKNS